MICRIKYCFSKIVDKFLSESDEYYISQWISYLQEIKLEDFENYSSDIVVSTIHKSKGMEFDKVYLLVKDNPNDDSKKRLYYVGMTRAKEELCILRYGNDIISKKDYVEYLIDNSLYTNENKIFTHIMSLQDISLGFDVEKYAQNNSIMSGYKVMVDKKNNFNNLCVILNSRVIGTFSKLFQDIINQKLNNGFMFNDIVIDNVVMWFDKDNSKYLKHALCKVTMKKMEKNKCCKQN